jgi:hypothetical protein
MKKFIYPTCSKTFRKWVNSKPVYLEKYSNLGKPKLFDITLKDGLQSLSLEEQYQFNINKKKEMLGNILKKEDPFAIELGSLASPKVLPIMKDTLQFYSYAYNHYNKSEIGKPYFFIYLYNEKQMDRLLGINMFNNISLSTSLTDSFQYYSTRQNLSQKKKELNNIVYNLDLHCYNREIITIPYPQIKLYINCFNSCPFDGKLNNDYVVDEICKYYTYIKPDILCLKDTCGNISTADFEYIIDKCIQNGINSSKISLHLHVLNNNEENTMSLINKAFDKKITMFDISSMKTGNYIKNTIYMSNINYPTNLTYELFYKTLVNNIKNKNKN